MANKYFPGAGDVHVSVGGLELTLRPSLDAALTLSRQYGGIRPAMTRVVDLDLDAIVSVIKLGVGRDEAKQLKNLDQMIYDNGLLETNGELVLRCVEYVSNLARGGLPEPRRGSGEEAGADGEDPTTAGRPR